MNKWYYVVLLLCISLVGKSQSLLTLEEAVSIALDKNFGIQIAKLEQFSAQAQVYKSNAGMGPVVDWNAGINVGGNFVNQKFTDGRIINREGRNINPNTNVTAGITLYDGGRMKATYEQLGLLSQFSELEGKIIIQNTVVEVMTAYYDITRFSATVAYLNTIIQYYEEQLKITEERWKVGKGSKLDFLQSQINLNAQLSLLAQSKNALKNAKVKLNGLLNREPTVNYVTEEINPDLQINLQLNDLVQQAKNKNRDLLLLQQARAINLKEEDRLKADRKPTISLGGSVGYSYNNTTAGFLLSNSNLFTNISVGSRWNLYDGNNRKNQIAIAKINTQIIEKQEEELEAQIINDLTVAYNQYVADLELLLFEEKNKTLAEENLSIALEKFRLGGSSILELNEAQRGLDTALNRLVNAQFNFKISRLDVLLLSGTLVN